MPENHRVSLLAVVAHPDDLEMMAGGYVGKLIRDGQRVHVLTVSNGSWLSPDGVLMRDAQEALREERDAANYLGYSVENLNLPAMDLRHEDRLVCEVLCRMEKYHCNTLLCPWAEDLHHDHAVVARIAISASRRVPRVLMGQINNYVDHTFTPNLFIDISDTWELKMGALQCYRRQWQRSGATYHRFLDAASRYYGSMFGVERAEAFLSRKYLLD